MHQKQPPANIAVAVFGEFSAWVVVVNRAVVSRFNNSSRVIFIVVSLQDVVKYEPHQLFTSQLIHHVDVYD